MEIEKLNRKKSNVETLLEIQNSKLPLILWGGGKLAEIFIKRFKRLNIPIKGVFSDNLKDFGKIINDEIEIESFETICLKNERFNILVAHGYPEQRIKYQGHDSVFKIFYLFDIHEFEMSIGDEFITLNKKSLNEIFDCLSDPDSKDSFNNYLTARYNNDWGLIYNNVINWDSIPEFLNLTKDEVVVDCGAYDGDSLFNYINKIGGYSKYYAIEPDFNNFKTLKNKIINLPNTQILNIGVWNKKDRLSFNLNDDQSKIMNNEPELDSNIIMVDTVDNICENTASFIKMDIEGAEYEALLGSVKTISLQKPKLAISIYHKQIDLYRLFILIKSIRSDYKFYFRLHNRLGVDAILYAV
jgi:FkbM family methyltransferase